MKFEPGTSTSPKYEVERPTSETSLPPVAEQKYIFIYRVKSPGM
jgi:hypothetical protein